MSVVELKNLSSLKVKLACGKDDNGKAIVRSKTFGNVKDDAVGEDLYDVVTALIGLQDHGLMEIVRQDNTILC